MSASTKFFYRNAQLFAKDPKTSPEKYNLYNGLANLSQEIDTLFQRDEGNKGLVNHYKEPNRIKENIRV